MTWTANRQALIEAGYLDRVFLTSIEHLVTGQLTGAHSDPHGGDEYIYEPRLAHQHAMSVASLLDRVLAFRREARDLEILATKVAMDYQLFDRTTVLDEALDMSRLGIPARELARTTHENSAKAFGSGDPLRDGFRAANEGRTAEIQVELGSINEQADIIRQRYEAQRAYHAAYRKKHTEPGNAHNYAERCLRLTQLFVQDLREAYAKGKAVALGLKSLWEFELPLPAPASAMFIDELVDWNRDAIRFLEFIDQTNVTFDLVVPLTQPWLQDGQQVLQHSEFRKALEEANQSRRATIPFRLSTTHFSDLKVRVLEVGFAYGNALDLVNATGMDRNATKDSYARLRIELTPPKQSYSDGSSSQPVAVQFGSVGLFGGNTPVDRCSSNAIRYINPVGEWRAEIFPLAVYKDDSSQSIADGITGSAPITDLKMHLRLIVVGPKDA